PLVIPSLRLLGQVNVETRKPNKAAQRFNEAIEMVENDDKYLQFEKFRVSFDDERRSLYEAAINFEFDRGAPEAAWKHLQKYQANVFLELLAQFNPNIEQTRATLDPARVQQLIPKDTQVIEYALMKDRLLIWLVTDRVFTALPVDVSRAALEDKVQTVLQKL